MQITLNDSRILAYEEYGSANGMPIFFFHGIPGSRIFRPPDEITAKMKVRLICVDRPGYGFSTFQLNRTILSWANDIAQLADQLGIKQFSVMAHSGGTPYVCACAYAMRDRVTCATIISGLAPADAPNILNDMIATNTMGMKVGRYIPWALWYPLMWMFYREGLEHPEKIIKPDAKNPNSPDTKVFSEHPDFLTLCRASTREAFHQGMRGHAWEAYLLVRPWGFDLDKIKVPIFLWHGVKDADASIHMGRYMASQIPNCKATFLDHEGHLLLYNHWEEIIKEHIGAS